MSDEQQQATAPPAGPDPAEMRDAVTRVAALGALLDEVKAAYTTARTDVQHMLDQQHRAVGTTTVDAVVPGAGRVGSISRTGGEAEAAVVDAEAFRAWVRDHFPSEHTVKVVPARIETAVQPAFLAQVLAQATAAGVARYADPATGELHDVPGVKLKPARAAGMRMTYTRKSKRTPVDGRELVAEAWRSGALAPVVLPALAPAPAGPPAPAGTEEGQ
ncbi:hypothetical protein ACSMX9_22735 [Streptomyces sp. LE64]|uniref:hypothetical protein n=1 Tax=Streptomyces sp. LE64 TaxID=3448653 RepID=UPI0040419CF5